jgi:hypothetical protein
MYAQPSRCKISSRNGGLMSRPVERSIPQVPKHEFEMFLRKLVELAEEARRKTDELVAEALPKKLRGQH